MERDEKRRQIEGISARAARTLLLDLQTCSMLHRWDSQHHPLTFPNSHRVSGTLAWKIPWTEEPGRLQSMGSLRVGTRLSGFTFTFHFHALEKEMASHSSVLAWRIPGTGALIT